MATIRKMVMQDYKKILAAVDFSEHTDAVIKRVLSLAQKYDSTLTILYVVDHAWPTDTDYVLPPIESEEDKLVADAHNRLDILLQATNIPPAKRMVVVGRPRQEILRMAEQEQADLIVLGAHAHHGLASLLGSTVDEVLHRASCDVLTVY